MVPESGNGTAHEVETDYADGTPERKGENDCSGENVVVWAVEIVDNVVGAIESAQIVVRAPDCDGVETAYGRVWMKLFSRNWLW